MWRHGGKQISVPSGADRSRIDGPAADHHPDHHPDRTGPDRRGPPAPASWPGSGVPSAKVCARLGAASFIARHLRPFLKEPNPGKTAGALPRRATFVARFVRHNRTGDGAGAPRRSPAGHLPRPAGSPVAMATRSDLGAVL
ncbi:hypothetical protein FJT64_015326 [Amphibalanus amphitrite]|uniref:Uncharacterized protein n=1 Tax=Amphibalanus amphitrite TaxID=1232801 RepID=A0A6A4XH66_AMPAM|nr:hypothetical protein FJT64_015326 [Amphibalanus amphitrite]